jgi:hypothetical protein
VSTPNYQDADLLLRIYDMRREPQLRQARDLIQKLKFKNAADFEKRYPEGSPGARAVGKVLGYWELACTLVDKGLLNEELFQTTNFEHVGIWHKFRPLVESWRKQWNYPDVAAPLQRVAERHPAWKMMDEWASQMEQPKEKKTKAAGR